MAAAAGQHLSELAVGRPAKTRACDLLALKKTVLRCMPDAWAARRWEPRGGKSNSFFAKTRDDRFIVKQLSAAERKSFQELAPNFFGYLGRALRRGQPTCLAKIMGVFTVRSLTLALPAPRQAAPAVACQQVQDPCYIVVAEAITCVPLGGWETLMTTPEPLVKCRLNSIPWNPPVMAVCRCGC